MTAATATAPGEERVLPNSLPRTDAGMRSATNSDILFLLEATSRNPGVMGQSLGSSTLQVWLLASLMFRARTDAGMRSATNSDILFLLEATSRNPGVMGQSLGSSTLQVWLLDSLMFPMKAPSGLVPPGRSCSL